MLALTSKWYKVTNSAFHNWSIPRYNIAYFLVAVIKFLCLDKIPFINQSYTMPNKYNAQGWVPALFTYLPHMDVWQQATVHSEHKSYGKSLLLQSICCILPVLQLTFYIQVEKDPHHSTLLESENHYSRNDVTVPESESQLLSEHGYKCIYNVVRIWLYLTAYELKSSENISVFPREMASFKTNIL